MGRDVDTFFSRSPIVRRESGPWARWIDLSGGHGVYGVVTFAQDIVWLREANTSTSLLDADGRELDTGSGYSDHTYGYLTCLRDTADEASELAKRYGVTKDGPLSVHVTLRVREVPGVPAPKDRFESAHLEKYRSLPGDWCRPDDEKFIARCRAATWEERADLEQPSWIQSRTILEAVTWDSRNGLNDADQAATRAAALAEAIEGLPAGIAAEAAERLNLSVKAALAQSPSVSEEG